MNNQMTGYDWMQSYLGLSTLALLSGLLLLGTNSSVFLRIISTVPWYPQIMYLMIASSIFQVVLPFTQFLKLRWWSNNVDFFIWGAVVLAFFVNRQFGPVIFSCVAGMIGNLVILVRLARLHREENASPATRTRLRYTNARLPRTR